MYITIFYVVVCSGDDRFCADRSHVLISVFCRFANFHGLRFSRICDFVTYAESRIRELSIFVIGSTIKIIFQRFLNWRICPPRWISENHNLANITRSTLSQICLLWRVLGADRFYVDLLQVLITVYYRFVCLFLGNDWFCVHRSQMLISVCHRFACLF